VDCKGRLANHHLHEILVSCGKLVSLKLVDTIYYDYTEDGNAPEAPRGMVVTLLSAIAEYGLQLKELSLCFTNAKVDIECDSRTRSDLVTTIARLRHIDLKIGHTGEDSYCVDDESSICTLFSSPIVDIRSLNIRTYYEDPDKIAMMLQGCQNAEKLNLGGYAFISPVIMTVAASCHQLVHLALDYDGSIEGTAMKMLLQSCRQLNSLIVYASLDLQSYEFLGLYGGNLNKIYLCQSLMADDAYMRGGYLQSFPTNSPLHDPCFKQQRKRPMVTLHCDLCYLDVKSLAAFLSCFGVIDHLFIRLSSSGLGKTDTSIPAYHAHHVTIAPYPDAFKRFDSEFIAIMTSCRSLRDLTVEPLKNYYGKIQCFVDVSTLFFFAFEYRKIDNTLVSLSYPSEMYLHESVL
jgi:hypothetical protein